MDISLVAFLFVGRKTTIPATFCEGHGKRQPELTWQIFFNSQRHSEPSFLTDSLEQGGCFWFTTHAGQNVSLPYGLTVFTSHSFMPRIWITARTLLRDSPHELIINVPGSDRVWVDIYFHFPSLVMNWALLRLHTLFLHKSDPSACILRNAFLWSLVLFSNFPGGHIAQPRWTDFFSGSSWWSPVW